MLDHVDLLFTEMASPGMQVPALAKVPAAERPGLRTIYASGYTDDAMFRNQAAEGPPPYVAKPFTARLFWRGRAKSSTRRALHRAGAAAARQSARRSTAAIHAAILPFANGGGTWPDPRPPSLEERPLHGGQTWREPPDRAWEGPSETRIRA